MGGKGGARPGAGRRAFLTEPRSEYRKRVTEKERKLLDAYLDVIRKIEQTESAASDGETK
jgi:hypothetical protein